MNINIIAVDDEYEGLQNIKLLLAEHNDCNLVDTCTNGRQAIKSILKHKPHIVFLDIQMPEVNGFDVVKALIGKFNPIFIFVTAYDKYAVDAFEINALDYLLKPFDDLRFHKALKKARNKLDSDIRLSVSDILTSIENISLDRYITRLSIKNNQKIYFVEVKNVMHFQSENHYVNIHMLDNTKHLIRDSLNRLEDVLDPKVFFRCHRSSIIRINEIKQIEPYFNGASILIMKNGKKIKLSKHRKELLKQIMKW